MRFKIKLQSIYEDATELKLTSGGVTYKDGGSKPLVFSDGFSCMFDWGIGSPTKGKFVKSSKDRTVIIPDEKYLNILRNDERYSFLNKYI